MIFELRAADLELVDVESALLRAAVGDYAAEAAVLLLAGAGHWLPQLQAADLIALVDVDDPAGPWAQVAWPELDAAVLTGRITGSSGQLRLLRAAASLADGQPVDLGDVSAGLDRVALTLLLAAIAHAGGSHDQPVSPAGQDGPTLSHTAGRWAPLVAWPTGDDGS